MELILNGVSKKFGEKKAVDNISLEIGPGIHGLLGANGAGKTTLMRMVCGVLKPTNGEIQFNDKDVNKLGEEYLNALGYLPQDFGYYPGEGHTQAAG